MLLYKIENDVLNISNTINLPIPQKSIIPIPCLLPSNPNGPIHHTPCHNFKSNTLSSALSSFLSLGPTLRKSRHIISLYLFIELVPFSSTNIIYYLLPTLKLVQANLHFSICLRGYRHPSYSLPLRCSYSIYYIISSSLINL